MRKAIKPSERGKKRSSSLSRQRSFWRSQFLLRRLIILGIILAILSVISITSWILYRNKPLIWLHYVNDTITGLSVKAGLDLQNIYLEGKNYTRDDTIIKALNVKIGQPLLSIPLDDIKKRLEKIDWIKTAIVERELPNTLRIEIFERKPIALWQNDRKLYLVDEEGALINEENLQPFRNLVILVGADAPLYANQLLTMLKKDMDLYKHVNSAIWIGERRWNIRFTEGIEIKLPEENPDDAWQIVIKMYHKNKLFSSNIRSIDMRVQGKLFVVYQPPSTLLLKRPGK